MEMEAFPVVVVVVVMVVMVVMYMTGKFVKEMLLDPYRASRCFQKQGVPCLSYKALAGNAPDIARITADVRSKPLPVPAAHLPDLVAPFVLPHYHHWKSSHGDPFVFWLGPSAILTVPDPEVAKEILSNKLGHFKLIDFNPETKALIGGSIASLDGERWARHRRIVSPAFYLDKIKVMAPIMVSCVGEMLDRWEQRLVAGKAEVDVSKEFQVLTADVIARTAFGSSYEEGKRVFELQHEQLSLLAEFGHAFSFPGSRFLPTSHNRRVWRVQKEIQARLRGIIAGHAPSGADDLLGILLAANRSELSGSKKRLSLSVQEIVDNCKMFYLAGYETTATLLTWTTMLLAVNPEWQERTREEALRSSDGGSWSYESLHNLKLAGMVIHEALRMYPPAPLIMRQAAEKTKVGDVVVPRKTMLFIPVVSIHHDPALWGADASEFNPQRFAGGISGAAQTPSCFFPFSMGPRTCLGQHFALLEARATLASMLRRFRFSLSPGYRHAPVSIITIQPQYGMQIIVERL